jgi:hypothetical protein
MVEDILTDLLHLLTLGEGSLHRGRSLNREEVGVLFTFHTHLSCHWISIPFLRKEMKELVDSGVANVPSTHSR